MRRTVLATRASWANPLGRWEDVRAAAEEVLGDREGLDLESRALVQGELEKAKILLRAESEAAKETSGGS